MTMITGLRWISGLGLLCVLSVLSVTTPALAEPKRVKDEQPARETKRVERKPDAPAAALTPEQLAEECAALTTERKALLIKQRTLTTQVAQHLRAVTLAQKQYELALKRAKPNATDAETKLQAAKTQLSEAGTKGAELESAVARIAAIEELLVVRLGTLDEEVAAAKLASEAATKAALDAKRALLGAQQRANKQRASAGLGSLPLLKSKRERADQDVAKLKTQGLALLASMPKPADDKPAPTPEPKPEPKPEPAPEPKPDPKKLAAIDPHLPEPIPVPTQRCKKVPERAIQNPDHWCDPKPGRWTLYTVDFEGSSPVVQARCIVSDRDVPTNQLRFDAMQLGTKKGSHTTLKSGTDFVHLPSCASGTLQVSSDAAGAKPFERLLVWERAKP